MKENPEFGASRLFAKGEPLGGYVVPAESTAQRGVGERLNSVAFGTEAKELIVTGGHSILVDEMSEEEHKKNRQYFCEDIKIDDKYLLLACVSDKFEKIQNNDTYTYYHFTLENDGDDDRRFGVWANEILTETPSKNQYIKYGL
jgi:hypothetical protein